MELLRIATAGSVDDGKSTLIGRLLFDSKAIEDDILSAAESVSRRQSGEYLNLALLTDGLRAEREQGITIDVAYRYFSTAQRKFILADTPGHVQYTRNMVTGASTADVALIIIDARNGVVEQSRRHAVIAALLGIRHVVVCINKMDLVEFSEEVFAKIRKQFDAFLGELNVGCAHWVPISALDGDNVVKPSERTPWYSDGPLLQHLEQLEIGKTPAEDSFRLPVQYVIRPLKDQYHDYRGYAGSICSGVVRVGQRVGILPQGKTSRITAIETPDGAADKAAWPTAVTVRIEDDIDISRGDLICAADGVPRVSQMLDATICWMSESSDLREASMFRIKHTTRSARAVITALHSRIDMATLSAETDCEALKLNEIGRVSVKASAPIVYDDYSVNRVTGSFILVDVSTNETVAAGMIGKPEFGNSDLED
jgi:bifunctional enzyme CysN/CysC